MTVAMTYAADSAIAAAPVIGAVDPSSSVALVYAVSADCVLHAVSSVTLHLVWKFTGPSSCTVRTK